ncbi:MAG: type IV pilus modification PilV family protein [Terrimicrobiaceae bacterium]
MNSVKTPLLFAPGPNVRVGRSHNAFSLIEIVLALGVIAFALVGIMGLFPVAMKSAQESQRETRATLIAQQIFSDLRVLSGTNRMLVRGASAGSSPAILTNFNLSQNTTAFMAYDAEGRGQPNTLDAASFSNSMPDAAFLASIASDTNTGVSNLSRVQTTIETPASAPSTNRSRYTFVTLMNY